MVDEVPLYVVGLKKDDPINKVLLFKYGESLNKVQQVFSQILEAKISVKFQNTEGSRTHYDVTSIITTSNDQLVYTHSGWNILKICDELCRKLERELPKHDNKRQRSSIRKKEEN